MTNRNVLRSAAAAATLTVLALMVLPATGSAAVTCAYDSGTDEFEVELTNGSGAVVVRDGNAITVSPASDPDCLSGSATVTSTATVAIEDLSGSDNDVALVLGGGPFAPGAGEAGDTDEIEFVLESVEQLTVVGTEGVENLRFGESGVNLNQGEEGGLNSDADVTFTGLEEANVRAGANDDIVSGAGFPTPLPPHDGPDFPYPLFLQGAEGEDRLTGGAGDDTLGSPDEAGDDTLRGGDGDDELRLNRGDDEADGGPGTDLASYFHTEQPVTVDLALTDLQHVSGSDYDVLANLEDLEGSQAFSDELRGNGGPNLIKGFGGSDLIDPRGGQDTVMADQATFVPVGDDRVLLRDGAADSVVCLEGVDSVVADEPGVDSIAPDCENVEFPPPPAPPTPPATDPPAAASSFEFGVLKRNKRRGTAKLNVVVPTAGSVAIAASELVKGATARANSAGQVTLLVKPSARARQKLANSGKAAVTVEVTFTPDGGEPSSQTKALKLRKRS